MKRQFVKGINSEKKNSDMLEFEVEASGHDDIKETVDSQNANSDLNQTELIRKHSQNQALRNKVIKSPGTG